MSTTQLRDNSVVATKRLSQWEDLMRKFSQSQKEQCKSTSINIPRVRRSIKEFPTGSHYEGTWDLLGMSGYGHYKFPNGVIYEGEFDDGMFHGSGDLIYPSGAILQSKWVRGHLVDRTLIFADGSKYAERDWKYCKMPDRRFTIEHDLGFKPAGQSYLTANTPTREIPHGYYDTEDGFYEPRTKVVYSADDPTTILRCPSDREQAWIVDNCRTSPDLPLGPKPSLYEKWLNPQRKLEKLTAVKSSTDLSMCHMSSYEFRHKEIFEGSKRQSWRGAREESIENRPSIQFRNLSLCKSDN